MKFYTILTQYGKIAIAEAIAAQQPLIITEMAAGDGGGDYYEPTDDQMHLRNECWRGDLNDLRTDESFQGQIIAEMIIPTNAPGGWSVREVGLYDGENNLIAIGKYPEIYIPEQSSGASSQVCIRILIYVGNSAAVSLTSSPDTALANKLDVYQAGFGVVGDFSYGLSHIEYISNSHQLVLDERTRRLYQWLGSFPKYVPPNSTPEGTGGVISNDNPQGLWRYVTDANLRDDLREKSGAKAIRCQSGLNVQQELENNRLHINQSEILSSFSENGGQVFALRSDLENPLNQFVGIYLVGDSITWGLSASYYATSEPRNHSLSDARNNSTSPSWANLFHKYLGERFFKNPTYTEANWPSSPSGVCEFTYQERVNLYPFYTPFSRSNGWSDIIKAGSLLNRVVESTTLNSEILFEFTGYEFDVVFSSLDDSGTLSIYSNDTLIDTIDTSAATNGGVKFQNKHTVSLPTFSSKANIRLVFTAGAWMRLEGLVVNKTVRVTNQGLIGTNSDEWVNSLIQPARRTGDKYCFIQLGTNDRGGASSARASNAISKNMQVFAEYLRGQGVQSIFMCANNVTQTGNFYYHMQDVSRAIANSAKSQLVDFINHLPVTTVTKDYIDSVVNDKLHPNDTGHYMMFLNIAQAIENASGQLRAQLISVKKRVTAPVGVSNVAMRLPFLSNLSLISGCSLKINNGKHTVTFGDVLTGAVSDDGLISGTIKKIVVDTSAIDNVIISLSNQTGSNANITLEVRAVNEVFIS